MVYISSYLIELPVLRSRARTKWRLNARLSQICGWSDVSIQRAWCLLKPTLQTLQFPLSLYQVGVNPQQVSIWHGANLALGFLGMNICSTGFVRIDLLHLSKLVTLVGE